MSLQPIDELLPKLQEIIKLFQSVQEPKAKRTRRLSFNDRTGLHGAIEDVESDHQKYKPVRTFERARSYGSSDEDIDKKAEIFIKTFRQQLLMERQVSLQLRYYRGNSFGRDY
ncbi:hypothetical protein OIU85_017697 [Salix viminalis]|uniref:Uncharacterized protein n=1 Tax=Salix viminalis TaxID=40686 RepID=A0A9Q0V7Y6_SALVM|nr:hypothetical protein OIU85_017697 [Salix viminalis]